MDPLHPSYLITRAWFWLRRRLGILQRQTPAQPWMTVEPVAANEVDFVAKWKSKSPSLPIALLNRAYLAPHLEQYAVTVGHSPEAEAKAIAGGRFRLGSGEFINLGVPPAWIRGQEAFALVHWTKVPADITTMEASEVSHFNWVYTLVRAWILSGDDTHAETFWVWFENWLKVNPPNLGPQWVSDEAIARRLLAVTFATQAFRFHSATTDHRLIQAARFITVSAEHLHLTLSKVQACSPIFGLQSAAALFTAGALWSSLPAADSWRSAGLESLINEGKKLNLREGSSSPSEILAHVQVLEIYTWTEIILRSENERESLPESLQIKIRSIAASAARLPAMTTSCAPLFSLSGCASGDVRPAVAAASILFTGVHYTPGPWDESTLLLVGPMCTSAVVS